MSVADPLVPKIDRAIDTLACPVIEAEGSQPGTAGTHLSLIAIEIEEGAVTARESGRDHREPGRHRWTQRGRGAR